MKTFEENKPQVIRLKEVESTNVYVRQLLNQEEVPEGSIIVADNQTAGKGQPGNTWETEAGCNLTFSLVLHPDMVPSNRQFLISQITALAVKDALEKQISPIKVKWPNDIYYKDKKICGILIENDLMAKHIITSILGVGININQPFFRSDAPNPISLYQLLGKQVDRNEVLSAFVKALFFYYTQLIKGEESKIQQLYLNSLYRGKGIYPYTDSKGSFDALIKAVEPDGHLVLKDTKGQIRRYIFKEVSFVLS